MIENVISLNEMPMKFDLKNNIDFEDYSIVFSNNKEAYNWYITANENIKTAEILLNNKRYAHSIFFMQQCVECLIKGIFLEAEIILDPKNISHAPEKAFIQFYEKVGDPLNKANCEMVVKALKDKKIDNFEKKIDYFIPVINGATTQYEPNSNALSENHLTAKFIYVQTVLFCLAKLFEGTQQDTRYPMKTTNEIVLPFNVFNGKTIEEKCPSLITFINGIVNIVTDGIQ